MPPKKVFQRQIFAMYNVNEFMVHPFFQQFAGRKSSKYFDENTTIGQIKNFIRSEFYSENGESKGKSFMF